jgi:hypothetical protein
LVARWPLDADNSGTWVYLDYKKVLPQLKGLQNFPELLICVFLFVYNFLIAFWIVALLHGLGLGFDLSMVSWWLRGLCVVFTVILFVLTLVVMDYLSKQDVS